MSTKNGFQTWFIVLILCVVLLVSTNAQVSAQLGVQNGDEIQSGGELNGDGVVPGGPGFIMVSAFDFVPQTDSIGRDFSMVSLYNPKTTTGVYVTGVNLPHGANLTKITLYYKDDATQNISVYFGSTFGGVTFGQIASFETDSSASSFRYKSEDIPGITVDNQNLSYFLKIVLEPTSLHTDLLVASVRIDYAYINSVPLVMK